MSAFSCSERRDVVRVAGPDALGYLHSQISQDVRPLAVGQSAWTLVLEPTGKVVALARVRREADEAYALDTDAGFGDLLAARLTRFKIRVKADIEQSVVDVVAVRGAGGAAPPDALVAWGDGWDLLGPAPADIPAGVAADLLAARIEAVWPAMGAEILPGETIPAETGITGVAVSFTKGCYPGQELVERMDSRGANAPRTLRVVDVPAGTNPGDPYLVDGAAVGVVTSVAGTRALAYVKRGS